MIIHTTSKIWMVMFIVEICRDINKSNESSFRRPILENDDLDDICETNIEVPQQTPIHEEKVQFFVPERSSGPEQLQPYETRVGR